MGEKICPSLSSGLLIHLQHGSGNVQCVTSTQQGCVHDFLTLSRSIPRPTEGSKQLLYTFRVRCAVCRSGKYNACFAAFVH